MTRTDPDEWLDGSRAQDFVDTLLAAGFRQSSNAPIQATGESDQFADAWGTAPRPLVVDANGLWGDVMRMAATGQRTVLFTAANMGVVRLYCARHVVDEMFEHHAGWAEVRGLSKESVFSVLSNTVAPLLRRVDLPAGLTTSDELDRLRLLTEADRDDVPTAELAMVLGAPLLTKDRHLLSAVYGPNFDRRAHGQWLDALRAGSTAGALSQNMRAVEAAAVAVGYGTWATGRAVIDRMSVTGVLAVVFAGAAAVAVGGPSATAKWRRATRRGGDVALKVLLFYAEMESMHRASALAYGQLASPIPDWAGINEGVAPQLAAIRDIAYTLAREQRSVVSVDQVGGLLERSVSSSVLKFAVRSSSFTVSADVNFIQLGGRVELPRCDGKAEGTDK